MKKAVITNTYIPSRRTSGMPGAGIAGRLRMYLEFVKIEHTLFALPFAYAGAFLAAHGLPSLRLIVLIATAFTGMRTAAMTLNRIIDREIDAANPRTANRHLPAGKISLREAYLLLAISLLVYFVSAWLINRVALELSPIPVAIAWIYPYMKRYTCLSHFVLGLTLAFAPIGGWVAVTDSFDPLGRELVPCVIGIAVAFWVAGFDIIYALQDVEFDRSYGLYSAGARFGVRNALVISCLCHIAFFALLSYALWVYGAGVKAIPGLAVIAVLLVYQHMIVTPRKYDEKRVQVAFFNANAAISALFFFTVVLAVF